jgi:predicted kinase
VARLILLNGPPGSGKSTLAGLYVEDHVVALNLDIDRVRDLLGRWREQPMQAGLLTRAMCLAMAHTHLGAGHDVVIPQYVAEVAFLQKVEQVATDAGAAFHEIALLDSRDNALRRFLTRAARTGLPAHTDAHDQLQDRWTTGPGTHVRPPAGDPRRPAPGPGHLHRRGTTRGRLPGATAART